MEPGAEERVDDDVVALRLGRLVGNVPRLAKDARRDSPVAAVRAAAAHARKALRSGEGAHRLLCHSRPGALHQLGYRLGIRRIAFLGGAHLLCRVERLE